MRTLLAIGLIAGALGGCASTTNGGTTEQRAIEIFRKICLAEPLAHAAFISLAPGRVGAKVVEAEAKAHAIVSSTCAANPTDWQTAAAAVSAAFANVLLAQDYAEKVAGVQ